MGEDTAGRLRPAGLRGIAPGFPSVEASAEGDGILASGVYEEERRTGAGVFRRSGAVEDGLLAGGEAPGGVGGGELNLVQREEDGAGGALGEERGLPADVDEDGATGRDGRERGLDVDTGSFALNGGDGGLAEADAAAREEGQGRERGQASEECEPAPCHLWLG